MSAHPKMICKACGESNTSMLSMYSLRCQKCGGELELAEKAWFGTRDMELFKISHFAQYLLIGALLIMATIIQDTFSFIILSAIVMATFATFYSLILT